MRRPRGSHVRGRVEQLESRHLLVAGVALPAAAYATVTAEQQLIEGSVSISLVFSKEVVGADNSINYQLQAAGADSLFGTADDETLNVLAAYGARVGYLTFSPLQAQFYRLVINDQIQDTDGAALDGDHDGLPGGDAILEFLAAPSYGLQRELYSTDRRLGYSMAASSGEFLVSGESMGEAHIYDASTGDRVAVLVSPTSTVSSGGFGYAVAFTDQFIAVSAPWQNNPNTNAAVGAIHIYDAESRLFLRTIYGLKVNGAFGSAISIAGNKLLVGSIDGGAGSSGAAHLYDLNTGQLIRALINPAPSTLDRFGMAVAAIDGYAIVGAPLWSTSAPSPGAAYVFDMNSGALVRRIDSPSPNAGDQFGFAIAAAGHTLAIGSPFDDLATNHSDEGAVFIFDLSSGTHRYTLHPTPGSDDNGRFGSSISIGNGWIVAGAPYEWSDDGYGAVHLFDEVTGTPLRRLPGFPSPGRRFGYAVAVASSVVAIGDPQHHGLSNDGGALKFINLAAVQRLAGGEITVQTGGGGAGQLLGPPDSGLTGLNRLLIDDVSFSPEGDLPALEDNSQTVVTPTQTIGDLVVRREVTSQATGAHTFVRQLDLFENVTDSDVTKRVRLLSTFKPGAIRGLQTTDGDGIVEVTDSWVATTLDDRSSDASALLQYVWSASGLVPLRVQSSEDHMEWEYEITIPGKTTFRVMSLSVLGDSISEAIDVANTLVSVDGLASEATQYLEPHEVESVVNFAFLSSPSPKVEFNTGVLLSGITPQLKFSEPVFGANSPSNYVLFRAGSDGLLDTADDVRIPVLPDYTGLIANLNSDFVAGTYRLVLPSTAFHDAHGRSLDGNGDGIDGDDFVYDFTLVPAGFSGTFPNPTPTSDDFGSAIAINETKLLVGAPFDDSRVVPAGAAYLYSRATPTSPQTLRKPAAVGGERFGTAVTFIGQNVAVGASHDGVAGPEAGAVYLFNSNGQLIDPLTSANPQPGDHFGSALASDNISVLVGAPRAAGPGSAFLIDFLTRQIVGTYADPDAHGVRRFGESLALSESYVLVGAPARLAQDEGRAYLFDRTTGALLQEFSSSVASGAHSFGSSVDLNGEFVVIGQPEKAAATAGAVFIYDISSGETIRVINDPDLADGREFGKSVAVEGTGVLVGEASTASSADIGAAVYLYDIPTGTLLKTFGDATTPASFGSAVAMLGDTVAVGSPVVDQRATFNGVLVGTFVRMYNVLTGAVTSIAYNPTAVEDAFGREIAVSGDHLAVSAPYEGRDYKGAVYSYRLGSDVPQVRIDNPTASSDQFGIAIGLGPTGLFVGAPGFDLPDYPNSGAVYWFDPETGNLRKRLDHPDPAVNRVLGSVIAVSPKYVAARSFIDRESVNIFDAESGNFIRQVFEPGSEGTNYFGNALAISGDTLIVGAPRARNGLEITGAVFIYDVPSGSLLRTLVSPNPVSTGNFGQSIVVSNGRLAVLAANERSFTVHIFDLASGQLLQSIEDPFPGTESIFDSLNIALDGDQLLIGNRLDDRGVIRSGVAYLYDVRSGNLVRELRALPPGFGEQFGQATALQAGTAWISSFYGNLRAGSVTSFELAAAQEILLASGSGLTVQNSGNGAGQIVSGLGAFDGFGRLSVDGTAYAPDTVHPSLRDPNLSIVVTPRHELSGLNIHRRIAAPPIGAFDIVWTLDVFENPGEQPVTSTVRIVGNLGSDGQTTVVATSDGDLDIESSDQWLITDDAVNGGGSPAVVHYLHGPLGLVPTSVQRIDDNLEWTYQLVVQPQSTVRVMHLTAIADTREAAMATAAALVTEEGLSAEASMYLTEEEIDSLANFQFPVPVAVVGRHVFYNQSKFDGNDVGMNLADDAAIATDKTALLPGQTSSFANYTSYNRGLNGLMVDIAGLPPTIAMTAADFEFKIGNSSAVGEWTPVAVEPFVVNRPGAGVDGSLRVSIIWPTGAPIKQWLQVTVKANTNTGLTTPDIFYFGNAVGESGNVDGDYSVSITDELLARNNPVSINPGTTVTNRFDYNRDGTVSVVDQLLARNNITTAATKLKQIIVPVALLRAQAIAMPVAAVEQPQDAKPKQAVMPLALGRPPVRTPLPPSAVDQVFETSAVWSDRLPLQKRVKPAVDHTLERIG